MPLTLALTHQPVLQTQAVRLPGWQRLVALADAAREGFATLWQGLFADVHAALTHMRLVRALMGPSGELSTRAVLDQTWQTTVDAPARTLLPALAVGLVHDAGQAVLPELSRLAEQPVTWTPGVPEVTQWINTYTGTQIRDISQTSLTTVRRVLHEGWQARQSPTQIATRLREVIGLTPSQERTIARLRVQLQGQGRSAVQVRQAVREATARALQIRAEVIALTESQAFAQAGAYQALQQSLALGVIDREQVRRVWVLSGAPCPEQCQPIPGLNVGGVGPDAPFQSPGGPVLFPPVHPQCRCSVAVRRMVS